MRFVGDIALDAEVRAIASGAITDGEPVIVNSTGTVSACVDATGGFGTAVEFESGVTMPPDGAFKSTFDSNSNKVVIGYEDQGNSNYGTAVVATIDPSDNSVSYGTPVVFESAHTGYIDLSFDSNVNKVVIAFQDIDDSYACKAIIGTVSSTAISFGSAVTFKARTGANSILNNTLVFDSNANKTAVFYVDFDDSQKLFCRVISISGTTPSYGTEVEVVGQSQYGADAGITATFDSNSNKVVVFYIDSGDSNKGKARVGTISGTDISFGTAAVFESDAYPFSAACAFDSTNNKTVNIYRDSANSSYGTATVGTVSGTDISFGTPVVYTSHAVNVQGCVYDSSVNRIIVLYRNSAVGDKGWYNVAQVSGTTLSFGTAAIYLNFSTGDTPYGTYDSNAERILLPYRDTQDSNKGKAVVMHTPVAGNLTSENFIGFAHAAYADGQKATVKTTGSIARNIPQQGFTAASTATPVVFDSDLVDEVNVTYDTNENRVVITYHDSGNSYYGTAIVGTLSGTTISYGTPVVYNSNSTSGNAVVFDSTNNKILITYSDLTSDHTQARVGVVSGTSISFPASETTWSDNLCVNITATYDDVNDQIVIFARETNGNGVVIGGGTHSSDNQLDFSAANAFVTSIYHTGAYSNGIVFIEDADGSGNHRVIVAFSDTGNSSHGTIRLGYAGGGSVKPYTTTGSAVVFHSANTKWVSIAKLPTVDQEGKFVIAYSDVGNSNIGEAIVGKIDKSDSSVSFGTAVTFSSQTAANVKVVYDTSRDKVFISYFDGDSDGTLHIVTGTVSGTSISFADRTEMSSATGNYNAQSLSNVYIPDGNYIVTAYRDNNPGGDGTAVVYTPSIAAVDLTIGQQYFVQTDGSLGTSADDPSVIAGTAIGTSDIIVKG